MIEEYHTTEMTAPCMRRVMLRHEGKVMAKMTTALYRGIIAGHILGRIHDTNEWDPIKLQDHLDYAVPLMEQQATEEQRPFSESVCSNLDAIHKEVLDVCQHYIRRQADYFERSELIGTEIPCRMTLEIPELLNEPAELASHIDLLYIDPNGIPVVRDWKWHHSNATMAYLSRNLQFAMYFLIVAEGSIMLETAWEMWEEPGWYAECEWCHLPSFKPYGRGGTRPNKPGLSAGHPTGLQGEKYKAGEDRPENVCLKRWSVDPDKMDAIKRELALRVRLMRAEIFPTTPDKEGCLYCESSHWCESFGGATQ